MLYYYYGNSEYLLNNQIKAWRLKFLDKFGDFNLVEIKDLDDIDNNFLTENLIATSFLNENKLVIIKLSNEQKEKNNYLITLLDKIPENNIILFYQSTPDKRSKLHKELIKQANTKEFNINSEQDITNLLKQKYLDKISIGAINTIIKYKGSNIDKIFSEINKLLITKNYIDIKDITENIIPEIEESIFQIIDDILNLNKNGALKKIDTILNYTNIYAFYNNLLANLRTNIYILKLKNIGLDSSKIQNILNLGNRSFLINKSYKINFNKLNKLYISLINLDKKMKTGNLVGNDDDGFRNEIETCLLII